MADEEKKVADAKAEEATEEKKDVEVPAKFKSLVEEIEKMSVLDLSELVSILEDKFGVSSAAPVMAMAAGAAAGGEAAEEKSEFNVELTGAGEAKINVIKAIREITELGLKEAKDMVDGAPTMIKEGVKKEEAEEMKKKIEEAGGTVTLK
ncbi:MAG: 50S ribosomal protein L7/L12 [Candidatus Komeilibacteria bacterium]